MRKDHTEIARRAVWVFAADFYRINKWIDFQDLIQTAWELVLSIYPKWRRRRGQALFTYLYGHLHHRGRILYRNHKRHAEVEGASAHASRPSLWHVSEETIEEATDGSEVEDLARRLYSRMSPRLPDSDRVLLATMMFPSKRFLRYVRASDRNQQREVHITNQHYASFLGMSIWTVNRKVSTLQRMIKDSINE